MGTLLIRWKQFDPLGCPCPAATIRHTERVGMWPFRRWQTLLIVANDALSTDQFQWLLREGRRMEWALFQTTHVGLTSLREGQPFKLLLKAVP